MQPALKRRQTSALIDSDNNSSSKEGKERPEEEGLLLVLHSNRGVQGEEHLLRAEHHQRNDCFESVLEE